MQFLRNFIFFLLICPAMLFAQEQKMLYKNTGAQWGPFTINGKIGNYHPNDGNGFITFRISNLAGRLKDTSVVVGKDGSFKMFLNQAFEGDISFSYRNKFFRLYALSGGEITIDIDEDKWNINSYHESVAVSGNSAQINKWMLGFTRAFRQHQFKTIVVWEDSSKTDMEVAKVRLKRMQEEKMFVLQYLQEQHIQDKKFRNWALNEIIYQAGADIAFEEFTSARHKSLTIPQLMDVLNGIKVENREALHNAAYFSFLQRLQGCFQIIININPQYKAAAKQNGFNLTSLYLDNINKYSTGLSKQLLYYNLYLQSAQTDRVAFRDRFDSVIVDKNLLQYLALEKNKRAIAFDSFDLVARIRNYKADSSIKKRLLDLFISYQGSSVLVDFWGSWCSPCMRELPYYPALIKELNNQQLKFLFFAVDTEDSVSESIQKKYAIKGEFVVLNDNEVKILNNVLRFNSYPSHFLVNPASRLIADHFSYSLHLNNQTIKALAKEINACLAE